ncbi:cytochrome c biogenesis protein CcsA, partial [Vibrio astriarenae]
INRPAEASWFSRWLDLLPPLLTLEKLLFRLIGAGFVLLTLTIASGALFSEQLFHRAFQFDHKNVFAVLSWLMFGGILVGRRFRGWRGRVALR